MSQINRYDRECDEFSMVASEEGGFFLHTDHLASHAFDEEKERALFEADMVAEGYDVRKEPDLAGVYVGPVVHTMWQGWKRCARSRAKASGRL